MSRTCLAISGLLLFAVQHEVTGAEDCASITVIGGLFNGTFEEATVPLTYSEEGSTSTGVLQAVSFATGRRTRRSLADADQALRGGSGGGGGGEKAVKGRALADEEPCETQMWILADTSELRDDGFPYYSAFDCADHPADVQSTWIYVDCEDCAEVSEISVVCTSSLESDDPLGGESGGDGDDSALTVPIIVGIATAGVVLVLCLGCCVLMRKRRKKSPKGNNTFADESDHSAAHKEGAGEGGQDGGTVEITGGRAVAAGASVEDGGETVISPMVGGVVGAKLDENGKSRKSFKLGREESAGGGNPAQKSGGIFAVRQSGAAAGSGSRPTSLPGSADQEGRGSPALEVRKDSMVAAAAAAGAARSRAIGGPGQQQQQQQPGLAGVLRGGVVGAPAARGEVGENIQWSAGQDLRYEEYTEISPGSEAGSVFEIAGPDDNVQEHVYYEGGPADSVAASSPGAYSMYSHYTAGGGMYTVDASRLEHRWSGTEEEEPSPRQQHQQHQQQHQQNMLSQSASPRVSQPLPPPPPPPPPPPGYDETVARRGGAHAASPRPPRQGSGGVSAPQRARLRSPAGLVARADRSTRMMGGGDGRGGDGERTEDVINDGVSRR